MWKINNCDLTCISRHTSIRLGQNFLKGVCQGQINPFIHRNCSTKGIFSKIIILEFWILAQKCRNSKNVWHSLKLENNIYTTFFNYDSLKNWRPSLLPYTTRISILQLLIIKSLFCLLFLFLLWVFSDTRTFSIFTKFYHIKTFFISLFTSSNKVTFLYFRWY